MMIFKWISGSKDLWHTVNNMRFNYKKATQIINFFLTKAKQEKKGKVPYKTHLLKLLYLVDRTHIRKYGTFITNTTYEAWQYGPVSLTAKDLIENIADKEDGSEDVQYASTFIDANRPWFDRSKIQLKTKRGVDWDVIAEIERETIEGVWEKWKDKSTDETIEILHTFPEWKDVYKKAKTPIPTKKILEGEQEGFPKVSAIIKEYVEEQEALEAALAC